MTEAGESSWSGAELGLRHSISGLCGGRGALWPFLDAAGHSNMCVAVWEVRTSRTPSWR